ncbi:MAG: enoyl-CoA hydratase/isomerase family protein [Myxococcaceae bacterium]|nr:enoyl-CoA hydratase/isomerase family protein [Myxococcaceae bacterium]
MGIEVQPHGDVTLLRIKGGRANAMSVDLLKQLEGAFADVAHDKGAKAVVLTGDGNAFSAGLALPDLIALDRPAMRDFIAAFERSMQRVLTTPKPVVAALNGHAIAGGCVLALMCDARLAAQGGAKVGLNEVQLGIGLPSLVIEPLRARVPASSLLPVAYEGRLFGVDDAHRLGLLDAVVPAAELEAMALARAKELGKAPQAFAQIKQALLRPVLEAITRNAPADREAWLDSWFSPEARRLLEAAVAKLTSRA